MTVDTLTINYPFDNHLKIDNKLKPKRNKASIVSAIFCPDVRHELNFEFLILNF